MPDTNDRPKDQVLPDGRWQFDQAVTDVFDDMLGRSIPEYQTMRALVTEMATRFIQPGTDVVDLGCSRGEAMAPLLQNSSAARFIGIEVSQPMLDWCEYRFEGLIQEGRVFIQNLDLRREFPACSASLVLSVLTLQFTPIEYRQAILQRVYQHMLPGGAFILVEKVLGSSANLDRVLVEQYYGLKRGNGYSEEQIQRKRMSLEGVLVPVTAQWNEQLLRTAGFTEVECFWRNLNFAGWVALKPAQ